MTFEEDEGAVATSLRAVAPSYAPAPNSPRSVAGPRRRVRRGYGWFAARRVGQSLVTLLGASVLIWLLDAAAPGDPAASFLASRGDRNPTVQALAAARRQLGLDHSAPYRYFSWLIGLLHGNLGTSYITGRSVRTEIASRLGATLTLAGAAITLVILAALILGLVAAFWVWRWPDVALRGFTVVAAAVPGFIVGLFLIQYLVIKFGIGEVITNGTPQEVLLPALAVAVNSLAVPTRVLRSSILTAMQSNYALLARARGARRISVLLRHGLPNALVPFINALALSAAWMIGGTVVVETVFTWPGIGSYLVQAVAQRNLPVVEVISLIATAAFLGASLLADLLTALIDPRVDASLQ